VPYPLGHVNAYLIEGETPILVDPGMDLRALEAALLALGIRLEDVGDVLITHHHPDHYALAGRLEAMGKRIWLPETEIEAGHRFWLELERWIPAGRQELLLHGAPRALADEMEKSLRLTRAKVHPPKAPRGFSGRFTLGGRDFLALPAPGHAEGQAALLLDGEILLVADALLKRISPMVARWPYSENNPLKSFLETLDRLAGVPAEAVLPGHFEGFDLKMRAQEIKTHHAERLAATRAALNEGPKTAWEVSLALFPDLSDPTQRRFALAETLAHLAYLEAKGEVRALEGTPRRYAT